MPADNLSELLIAAIKVVAEPGTSIEASTPLDETTLDSIGLLEAMVHLEDAMAVPLPEEFVRQIALEPDYDPSMSIGDLAGVIQRLAGPAPAGGTAT